LFFLFFFFSSRRRHTRSKRDWSSDVCSSDLLPGFRDFYPDELALRNHIFAIWREVARRYGFQEYDGPPVEPLELYTDKSGEEIEIGRASCRERGEMWGVDVA